MEPFPWSHSQLNFFFKTENYANLFPLPIEALVLWVIQNNIKFPCKLFIEKKPTQEPSPHLHCGIHRQRVSEILLSAKCRRTRSEKHLTTSATLSYNYPLFLLLILWQFLAVAKTRYIYSITNDLISFSFHCFSPCAVWPMLTVFLHCRRLICFSQVNSTFHTLQTAGTSDF